MKYLITRKVKKLTKSFKNSRLEITIPENQMIEVAYKASTGEHRKEQVVGAYVYLKMGENVYPSIVEFSMDEVELIGDKISKTDLFREAVTRGRLFFINKEICSCWEFVRHLNYTPYKVFTIVNDNEHCLRVACGFNAGHAGKNLLAVIF